MAEERVRGTRAGLGPRVDVGYGADQSQRYYDFKGTYDYNQGQPAFQTDASASASYNIDISGVQKRQLRQARLSEQSSKVDSAQARLDVSSDIRTNYVQALRAQEQVEAEEDYLKQIESLLERARAGQPSVVTFLESERSNAQQNLESTKQNADLAFSNLRQALRLKNDQPLELTSELSSPVPLPSTDRLLRIAFDNRNDLKQADIRLNQARLAKVQATDSRKPSLRASAYATQAFNGDYVTLGGKNHGRTKSAAAILNFNLPMFLYDGGQLKSQQNIATIQAEQAVADAEEAKERAENEINQVMIGLNRAQQRLKSLPDVGQARQSLEQAERQMLAASPTEAAGVLAQVTNARQNLRTSVLSRNDAVTDFYSGYFRLQRTLGTEDIGPQFTALMSQ
jgi:outer membrane protein TolC